MINKYILNILYKRYRVYMVYIPEKKKIKNRKKFIYIYTYACTNEIRFQPKRKKSIYINKKVKLTKIFFTRFLLFIKCITVCQYSNYIANVWKCHESPFSLLRIYLESLI